MMSAPSFMQDPPEYNQTIDQMVNTSKSMNEWVAPVEWQSFSEQTVSRATNDTHRSQIGLLTESEQVASRDNFSFPPAKISRKLSKSRVAASHIKPLQRGNSSGGQMRPPNISAPIPDTLMKNGIPNTPPPEFSSPTTYYAQQQSFHHQEPASPSASGSRSSTSPYPSPGPSSPTRERAIRFSQVEHPYRSSPRAI